MIRIWREFFAIDAANRHALGMEQMTPEENADERHRTRMMVIKEAQENDSRRRYEELRTEAKEWTAVAIFYGAAALLLLIVSLILCLIGACP